MYVTKHRRQLLTENHNVTTRTKYKPTNEHQKFISKDYDYKYCKTQSTLL